jgi:hypothetical protein
MSHQPEEVNEWGLTRTQFSWVLDRQRQLGGSAEAFDRAYLELTGLLTLGQQSGESLSIRVVRPDGTRNRAAYRDESAISNYYSMNGYGLVNQGEYVRLRYGYPE